MNVNKNVIVAIEFIQALNETTPTAAHDVVGRLTNITTYNNLEQIAVKLRRAGFITAKKGRGGGYVRVNRDVMPTLSVLVNSLSARKNVITLTQLEPVINQVHILDLNI